MMGNKQKLIDGIEYDVIYAKKRYCYLVNNNKLVKYVKNKMRKRRRKEAKKTLIDLCDYELNGQA